MEKPTIKVDVTEPRESEKDFKNLIQLTEDIAALQSSIDRHNEERPSLTAENKGYTMFDDVLGKPIWWNGEEWVDALGEAIEIPTEETSEDNNNNE